MPRPYPEAPERAGFELGVGPEPSLDIPVLPQPASAADASCTGSDHQAGQVPQFPVAVMQGPRVRTPHGRLAAPLDACYPAGSQRLSDDGLVVLRVTIGAGGQAGGWTVAQSSGFPRLDCAVD